MILQSKLTYIYRFYNRSGAKYARERERERGGKICLSLLIELKQEGRSIQGSTGGPKEEGLGAPGFACSLQQVFARE